MSDEWRRERREASEMLLGSSFVVGGEKYQRVANPFTELPGFANGWKVIVDAPRRAGRCSHFGVDGRGSGGKSLRNSAKSELARAAISLQARLNAGRRRLEAMPSRQNFHVPALTRPVR